MKLRDIYFHIIGYARGVAHLHLQVDVAGRLGQLGVFELAVGHHQVHAVAGHFGVILHTFRIAVKRHFTAGFNVLELVGIRARHQAEQGFEIRLQRLEGNVVGNIRGIGQPNGPGEAEREVVEGNLVVLERVQAFVQIHVHRHVGIELFVGHVGHVVIGHVQVGGRGLRLHVEHVAGEVAAAGVVHAARLHTEGEGQVLVAQAAIGQLPPFNSQAYLAGILPLGGGGRVRNHHVPVGQAAFQAAQAQVGSLQLHTVNLDFLALNHRHDIQPHAHIGQVSQRVAAERVQANHAQVFDIQR